MKTNKCVLYAPQGGWDTNYSLVDETEGKEYLIDICDVSDDDEEEYLNYDKLVAMEDIEYIKSFAWKTINKK